MNEKELIEERKKTGLPLSNFYCARYSNAEIVEKNTNCEKQCFNCMAIVGETRLKNRKKLKIK